MGWEYENAEEAYYASTPHDLVSAFVDEFRYQEDEGHRRRPVRSLRLSDLLPEQRRSHSKRPPVLIDGEEVHETLRERLTREAAELDEVLREITLQLVKRRKQVEQLERFPKEDPFENGTVLRFDKTFPNSPMKSYSYVAYRWDDVWFLTGQASPQELTWTALVDWMGLGVTEVFNVQTSEKVIG